MSVSSRSRGRRLAIARLVSGMVANVVAFSVAGFLLTLVGPRGVYAIAAGVAVLAALVLYPALKQMPSRQQVAGDL